MFFVFLTLIEGIGEVRVQIPPTLLITTQKHGKKSMFSELKSCFLAYLTNLIHAYFKYVFPNSKLKTLDLYLF